MEHKISPRAFFRRLIDRALVDEPDKKNKENNEEAKSLGQKFYEDMGSYFESIIKGHSVGGRMIYHMGYIVWVHPDDHAKLRQELLLILPEVIDSFYDIINKYKERYSKIMPPSTEWFIQVTPSKIVTDFNPNGELNDIVNVKKGEFIISSTPFSPSRMISNVQTESNVVLSFRATNSDVNKDVNINMDIMLGVDNIGGAFTKYFDYGKVGIKPGSQETKSPAGLGVLKFNSGGNTAKYIILDKNFTVSGSADQRKNQRDVLILPDSSVVIGHLVFHYNDEINQFEVAAYAHTMLNETEMKISTVGGEKHWKRVSRKSSFLLGDGFGLTFEQS